MRKLLSLILALSIVLSTVALVPMTASAEDISADQWRTLPYGEAFDAFLSTTPGTHTTGFQTNKSAEFLTLFVNNDVIFNGAKLFLSTNTAQGVPFNGMTTKTFTLTGTDIKYYKEVGTIWKKGTISTVDNVNHIGEITVTYSDNETNTVIGHGYSEHPSWAPDVLGQGTDSYADGAHYITRSDAWGHDGAYYPLTQVVARSHNSLMHALIGVEYSINELKTTVLPAIIDQLTTKKIAGNDITAEYTALQNTVASANARGTGFDVISELTTAYQEKYEALSGTSAPQEMTGLSVVSTLSQQLPQAGSLTLASILPVTGIGSYPGATVTYYLNGAATASTEVTTAGSYTVKTVVSLTGYTNKEFTTTLTVTAQSVTPPATDNKYYASLAPITKDGRILVKDGVATTPVYAGNKPAIGIASLNSLHTALNNDATDKTVGGNIVKVVTRTDNGNAIEFNIAGLLPTFDEATGTHFDSQMLWTSKKTFNLSGKYLKGVAFVGTTHALPQFPQHIDAKFVSVDNTEYPAGDAELDVPTYHSTTNSNPFVTGKKSDGTNATNDAYYLNYSVAYNDAVTPIAVKQIDVDLTQETGSYSGLQLVGLYEIEYKFDELTTVMTNVINTEYASGTTTDAVKESIRKTIESAELRGYDPETALGTEVYAKYRELCPAGMTGLSVVSTLEQQLPPSGGLVLSTILPVTGIENYQGATVKYYLNGALTESTTVSAPGVYTVKTVVSNDGFADTQFTTTLTVNGSITDLYYAKALDITKDGRLLVKDGVTTVPVYGGNRDTFGIASLDTLLADVDGNDEQITLGSKQVNAIRLNDNGNIILFDTDGLFPSTDDAAFGTHFDSTPVWLTKRSFNLSGRYIKGVAIIGNNHTAQVGGGGRHQYMATSLISTDKGNIPQVGYLETDAYHYSESNKVFATSKLTTTEGVPTTTDYKIHYGIHYNDALNPIPATQLVIDMTEATGSNSAFQLFGIYEIEYGFAELTTVMTNVINAAYADRAAMEASQVKAIEATIASAVERGYNPEEALGAEVYEKYLALCPTDEDTGSLTVVSASPANNETNVSTSRNGITFEFSNYFEPAYLAPYLTVEIDGVKVTNYKMSTYANRATLTFDEPFGDAKEVKVTIKSNFQDKYGHNLAEDYVLTFNTEIPAMALVSVEPAADAATIPTVDNVITFTFATLMDGVELAPYFELKKNGQTVSQDDYTLVALGKVVTLTLDGEFGTNNTYTYTVLPTLKDKFQQELGSEQVGSFTSDEVAFTMIKELPVVAPNGKINPQLNTLKFVFSTPVSKDTFEEAFTFIRNNVKITDYTITTEDYDRTIIVTLNGIFGFGSEFSLEIKDTLQDKYGQVLGTALNETFATDLSNSTFTTLLDVDFQDPVKAEEEKALWISDYTPQVAPQIVADPLDATNYVLMLTGDRNDGGHDVTYTRNFTAGTYEQGSKFQIEYDFMWGLSNVEYENGYASHLFSAFTPSGEEMYAWWLAGNSEMRLNGTSDKFGGSPARLDNVVPPMYNTKWTKMTTIIDPATSTIQYRAGTSGVFATRYIDEELTGDIGSFVTKVYKGLAIENGSSGQHLPIYLDNLKVTRIPAFTIKETQAGALSNVDPTGDLDIGFTLPVLKIENGKDVIKDKIKLYKNGVEIANNYTVAVSEDGYSATISIDGNLEYNTLYQIKVLKGAKTVSAGDITQDVEVSFTTTKAKSANIIDGVSAVVTPGATTVTATYTVDNPTDAPTTVYVMIAAYSSDDELLGVDKFKVENVPATGSYTSVTPLTVTGMEAGKLSYIKVFTFGENLAPLHLPVIIE